MDGPFRWLDGSAWDFTNWDDGEPDRKSVGRTHHECVKTVSLLICCCCCYCVVVIVVVVVVVVAGDCQHVFVLDIRKNLTSRCVFMGKNTEDPGKWWDLKTLRSHLFLL